MNVTQRSTARAEPVHVCIIGAGPSGLAVCRALMKNNVQDVLILEASTTVGGVWRPRRSGGLTWNGMRTNLSRPKSEFSELSHDASHVGWFVPAEEMHRYFVSYSEAFQLREKIRFSCRVEAAIRDPTGSWVVTTAGGETFIANHLVVCTGVFSSPKWPEGLLATAKSRQKLLDNDGVAVFHSAGFDVAEVFDSGPSDTQRAARVLVIGSAYSGADLSSAVSRCPNVATPVSVVCRSPRWFVPRWVGSDGVGVNVVRSDAIDALATNAVEDRVSTAASAMPWDLYWERRNDPSATDEEATYRSHVTHSMRHSWCAHVCRVNPGVVDDSLRIDVNKDGALTCICDSFLRDVEEGRLAVRRDIPADLSMFSHVICCTGYTCDLSFLDEAVRKSAYHDPNDDFLPLILYKATLHPTIDNVFFVGMFRGPYMVTLEVQSLWIADLIAGKCAFPDRATRDAGVALETEIRRQRAAVPGSDDGNRPHAFPHNNFVSFTDAIAAECQRRPEGGPTFTAPVTAAQYRLNEDVDTPRVVAASLAKVTALQKTSF